MVPMSLEFKHGKCSNYMHFGIGKYQPVYEHQSAKTPQVPSPVSATSHPTGKKKGCPNLTWHSPVINMGQYLRQPRCICSKWQAGMHIQHTQKWWSRFKDNLEHESKREKKVSMQEQDISSVHQYREVPSWTVEEITVGGIWQSLVTNYKAWPDLLWQAELHSNTWWLMWYITVQTDVGMQYSRLAINMNMCVR